MKNFFHRRPKPDVSQAAAEGEASLMEPQVGAGRPDPQSLPIVANYAIHAVERQLTESDTIAGRGYQVAGFASIVMGLVAVGDGGDAWLKAIIVAYVATVFACVCVLLPRTYLTSGSPEGVWKMNWDMPPEDVWHWLVANSIDAYEHNQTATRRRTWALLAALVGLAIETGLVGVRLL